MLLVAAIVWLPSVGRAASPRALDSFVQRCHTSGLAVSLSPMGAAAGNVEVNVSLRNKSRRSCFLSGYVGFGLQDAHYRPQPSQQVQGSTFFRADTGPQRVVLKPGARAVTNLAWTDNAWPGEPLRGQCEPPSRWLIVTPPGERSHLLARFGTTFVCGHGHLTSTALTSARAGWRIGY